MSDAPVIILTGNIASGKSTLCRALVRRWPQLRHVCADNYRTQLAAEGVHGLENEHRVRAAVLQAIKEPLPLLYESTGATNLYRTASSWLRGHRRRALVRIRTTCRHDTAMRRFNARKAAGYKQLAPQFPGALPVNECWYRFEDMLREPVDLIIDTDVNSPEGAAMLAINIINMKMPGATMAYWVQP